MTAGASHPAEERRVAPVHAGSVAIVTDSAASLPPDAVPSLGITVVPMSIAVGGTVYPDGSLDPKEVLQLIRRSPVSTSAPSPGAYVGALDQLAQRPVLIVTVSQRMSASGEAAATAAHYRPAGATMVLDSCSAAGGEGLVVLAAARAANRGDPLDEVGSAARQVASRVRLLACLGGLDQLARSGRVPGVAARAGRSLGVRPVFEFSGGEARARWPARSTRSGLGRIAAACAAGAVPDGRLRAAVLHAEAPLLAAELDRTVRSIDAGADVYVAPFSSVMVAHTGPGLAGLAWWWDDGTIGNRPSPR